MRGSVNALLFCLAFVSGGFAVAADKPRGLPVPTPVPNPMPPPTPAPVPVGPVTVAGDALYVADFDTDGTFLVHPANLLKVTKEAGPIKIRGKFADGNGQVETRTYSGKVIFIAEAAGVGSADVEFIPFGLKDASEIQKATVNVDDGTKPQPPPAPKPKPKPEPFPNPPPAPEPAADGAWVIVIADEVNPTIAQGQVVDGATLRAYKAKGQCRIYGSITESDKITAKGYDRLLADAGVKAPALVVLDKDGKKLLAQPLPGTDAAVAALLKGVMP